MTRTRLLFLVALVAAAVYFVADVRQRARLDRGVKRHRTDMTVYQAAAEALVADEDPYAARNPRGYGYVYPPLLAILFMPVAGWAPENAALVWFIVSMLAFGSALWLLARMTLGGPDPAWRAVLVAAVVCLGFWHQGFQRGQVTHLLLGLQVGALAALLGRRFLLAGLLVGLAGALRLTPLLPAAVVGLGLVVYAFKDGAFGALLSYVTGVVAALALGLVVLPWFALGTDGAREVNQRWLEVTRDLQTGDTDLQAAYRINEWRFKNQAPRRVFGTWAGWGTGAPFEKERPRFTNATTRHRVEGAAAGVAIFALLLALVLGVRWLRDPSGPHYALVFAAVMLLPVFVTRYAWPTHFLFALPLVAMASARAPWRRRGFGLGPAVAVLFVGAALFYAAHTPALQWLGEAGCLLLACAAFLGLTLTRGLQEPA